MHYIVDKELGCQIKGYVGAKINMTWTRRIKSGGGGGGGGEGEAGVTGPFT